MLRVVLFAAVLALATPAFAATPEEDIGAVLDQLHAAAAKADGPTYFGLYTPDAVFIGTDATERWSLPGRPCRLWMSMTDYTGARLASQSTTGPV